jgi:hypothetical protein
MEWSWIIFLAGTAASYWPIYRLIDRLRKARGRQAMPRSAAGALRPDRLQFIDSLRREALTRLDAALEAATSRPPASPGGGGLDQRIFERLRESRQMLQSLFPADAIAQLDLIISALARPASMRPGEIAAIVAHLKRRLAQCLVPQAPIASGPVSV